VNCGVHVDMDHLFVEFFGRIWYYIFSWLDFSTAFNGRVLDHIYQFGSLGGFSHIVQCSLNVICLSVAWVFWKERSRHFFKRKEETLQTLCERVKLQSYWWFKSKLFYSILSTIKAESCLPFNCSYLASLV
jgi:hypothetical protein